MSNSEPCIIRLGIPSSVLCITCWSASYVPQKNVCAFLNAARVLLKLSFSYTGIQQVIINRLNLQLFLIVSLEINVVSVFIRLVSTGLRLKLDLQIFYGKARTFAGNWMILVTWTTQALNMKCIFFINSSSTGGKNVLEASLRIDLVCSEQSLVGNEAVVEPFPMWKLL